MVQDKEVRVSNYIINLPLKNDEREYMLINSCLGNLDVLEEDLYKKFISIKEDINNLDILTDEEREGLIGRGYLTTKTYNEEVELFKRMAGVTKKVSEKFVYFTIMPTYNCNFRCAYCYERDLLRNSEEWRSSIMSKEVVDRIFEVINQYTEEGKKVNKVITLYGGEPLMKENFEIVKYILEKCNENGISVNGITNGYDLDIYNEVLEGNFNKLQITVDGIGEYHDRKRFLRGGKPTFDKIVENIELALKKNVEVSVRCNIDRSNINQIEKLVTFYRTKKWTSYDNFDFYFKNVHGCYTVKENYVKEDEIFEILQELGIETKKYKCNNVSFGIAKEFRYIFESGKGTIIRSGFCGATSNMLVVDPYGDLYACWEVVGNKDSCLGNIKDDIKGYENNKIYRYWRDRTITNIEKCVTCEYAAYCGGGCPAHVKAREGNIYLPYCSEYKEIFNEVIPEVYSEFIKESKVEYPIK